MKLLKRSIPSTDLGITTKQNSGKNNVKTIV